MLALKHDDRQRLELLVVLAQLAVQGARIRYCISVGSNTSGT